MLKQTSSLNSPAPSPVVPGQTARYLTFRLHRESYAVPVLKVSEIVRVRSDITRLPQAPDYVRGVINLRGRLIPVIDLRLRFALGEAQDTERTCTVVVRANDSQFGLVVDGVEEVLVMAAEDIAPPPNFGAHSAPAYLKGLARTRGGIKCLLDLDRIVSSETLDQISSQAADC